MSESTRRRVIGMLVPAIPPAALIAALVTWWDRLPDPVASHWSLGGDPDDSVGRALFVVLMVGAVAVTGLAAYVAARRSQPRRGELSAPVALATFLQWTFAVVAGIALLANLDAASWEAAEDVPILLALVAPAVAAVVAASVAAVARGIERREPVPDAALPSAGLGTGERAAWFGHMRVNWPIYLGGAVALIGVAYLIAIDLVPGLALVAASSAILVFASVGVSADRNGLTVRYGPFGWPRTRIPLERIEQTTVINVARGSHGGWGYRGSLRFMGKAALVLRSGEALQVDLRDGKRFVVTVDGAAGAAGVLNDLASVPS